MAKMKRKKNKLVLPVLLVGIFLSISCSVSRDHVVVKIQVKDPGAVDFNRWEKILYTGPVVKNLPKNYNPNPVISDFFLKEFSQVIKRDVELLNIESFQAGPIGFIVLIIRELTQSPHSLLVSSHLTMEIKGRSIIQTVKKESGKKEKDFVSVQNWVMMLEIALTDINTGKIVFKKDYNSTLKEADPQKPEYNFKSLFNELTDRFIRQVTKESRYEERFLLAK